MSSRTKATYTRKAKTKPKPKPKPKLRLNVSYVALDAIHAYPGNAKTHSQKQLAAIARSMAANGFVSPILIDEHGAIIAGHGRHEAAKLIGLEEAPVITLSHLTEAQKKAYRIADNRLAEIGTAWSFEKLQIEVRSILELDADFDIGVIGFDLAEIEIKSEASAPDVEEQDDVPAPEQAVVSAPGDLWLVGDHRVLCGDALQKEPYRSLLSRERAAMIFADPPYNVPIAGHVSGLGRHKHQEFLQASGEMSDAEFQQFLVGFMLLCAFYARPGALHFICIDWRHLRHLLLASRVAYDEQINLCVWEKANAGMGSLYRSQHELIAIFKKGAASHQNNVQLGANGRNRTNIWKYAGMTSPSAERDEALAMHPTVKPLALVRDAILDVTRRGDIVLDPFGGSGTTLIAAHAVGRVARLIELDPRYCDVILRRAARTLGLVATLASSGETMDQVAARRRSEARRC